MASITGLITGIWKGVIGLIRLSFFLLVVLVVSFGSGWLKVSCDADKIREDFKERINELKLIISEQNGSEQNRQAIQIYRGPKNYYFIEHKINAGERLIDLEKIYGVSWRVIQKANNISDPRRIIAGQIILIPVKKNKFG